MRKTLDGELTVKDTYSLKKKGTIFRVFEGVVRLIWYPFIIYIVIYGNTDLIRESVKLGLYVELILTFIAILLLSSNHLIRGVRCLTNRTQKTGRILTFLSLIGTLLFLIHHVTMLITHFWGFGFKIVGSIPWEHGLLSTATIYIFYVDTRNLIRNQ